MVMLKIKRTAPFFFENIQIYVGEGEFDDVQEHIGSSCASYQILAYLFYSIDRVKPTSNSD